MIKLVTTATAIITATAIVAAAETRAANPVVVQAMMTMAAVLIQCSHFQADRNQVEDQQEPKKQRQQEEHQVELDQHRIPGEVLVRLHLVEPSDGQQPG